MKQDLAVACQVLTSSEKEEAGGQERRTRQLLQRLAHIRLKGCVFLAMRDTHNLSTVLYETPSMSFLFVRQNGRAGWRPILVGEERGLTYVLLHPEAEL